MCLSFFFFISCLFCWNVRSEWRRFSTYKCRSRTLKARRNRLKVSSPSTFLSRWISILNRFDGTLLVGEQFFARSHHVFLAGKSWKELNKHCETDWWRFQSASLHSSPIDSCAIMEERVSIMPFRRRNKEKKNNKYMPNSSKITKMFCLDDWLRGGSFDAIAQFMYPMANAFANDLRFLHFFIRFFPLLFFGNSSATSIPHFKMSTSPKIWTLFQTTHTHTQYKQLLLNCCRSKSIDFPFNWIFYLHSSQHCLSGCDVGLSTQTNRKKRLKRKFETGNGRKSKMELENRWNKTKKKENKREEMKSYAIHCAWWKEILLQFPMFIGIFTCFHNINVGFVHLRRETCSNHSTFIQRTSCIAIVVLWR